MRSDYHNRPAFETIAPKRAIAPLVFNSAHSGSDYPKRFLEMSKLDKVSIRLSEDAYVNDLFSRAPHLGAPLLHAHFPRAYLDVNREPYELDQTMFAEKLPSNYNINSPRVKSGIGTLAKIVAQNKNIYSKKLTIEDAHMRIEGIYRPYHLTLQKLLTKTLERFGIALLIDCHSMPNLSRPNLSHSSQLKIDNSLPKFMQSNFPAAKERTAPDIVLGDRHGTTCSKIIVDVIESHFSGNGLKVSRNRPYAGGFITNSYANPAHNIHAIQIEISRHLYMNEATFIKATNYNALKQIIDNLIKSLINLDIATLARIQSNAAQ
ncbi:MAG: N-formylglutamate amidohydrolase [Devosiaceae bacterium]|nr:N-formylglutamate amidohydrolase [Devosiaceae bacterium]